MVPPVVVERALAVLNAVEDLRVWLDACPAPLPETFEPALSAAIAAWVEVDAARASCQANGGHVSVVVVGPGGEPVAVRCEKCTMHWPVTNLGQPVPSVFDRPVELVVHEEGEPQRVGTVVAVVEDKADAVEIVNDLTPCEKCGNAIVVDDDLRKATLIVKQNLCRPCMLTCEECGKVIGDLQQVMLSSTRNHRRLDKDCFVAA